ncbi:MAG TPA: ADP-ribosylglycohydrolase family protein, partial [Luteolibacter sp.]
GCGMLSDDTEHTIIASQALLSCGGDPQAFQKRLAGKLRWWFAGLPAGIGLATAKAIIKLWIGFPPGRNGIHSAGNGPVMRAPILGVYFAKASALRAAFVMASTILTHTDPKAVEAAMMAADCAAFATNDESRTEVILARMKGLAKSPEWDQPMKQIEDSLAKGSSVREFADAMGFSKGVSGYAVHTMTMVLFIWLKHRGDFTRIVSEAIACGGDTDSVAAIAGGSAGAETEAFNPEWLHKLSDRPYTVDYIVRLGGALEKSRGGQQVKTPYVANCLIIPRNIIFFIAVLFHGFRRIFPPY